MTAAEAKATPRQGCRPTNVSLDRALVDDAKSLGINLSQACERDIADQLAKTRAEQWLDENRSWRKIRESRQGLAHRLDRSLDYMCQTV